MLELFRFSRQRSRRKRTLFYRIILPTIFHVLLLCRQEASCQKEKEEKGDRCVVYGVCKRMGQLQMNCPYEGPPKYLADPESQKLIADLCPHLFSQRKDKSDKYNKRNNQHSFNLCCDGEQIETLRSQTTLPLQLLARCPSCYSNFMKLWCDFTCSPRQADFVRINRVENDNDKNVSYATGFDYFLDEIFASGLFNSCRGVRGVGGEPALSLMCGVTVDQCSAGKWLQFMGTASPDLGIPIDINFRQVKHSTNTTHMIINGETFGYKVPNSKITPCNESVSGEDSNVKGGSNGACSCQDCSQSCQPTAPYPKLNDNGCQIAKMDCMVAMSMLAFGGLCFAIMFMASVHRFLKPNASDRGDEEDFADYKTTAGGTLSERDISVFENLGAYIDNRLEHWCDRYGRLTTRHPFVVLVFGLCVAVVCSCGLIMVNFTTDPVELWSSPGSRARREKRYFDENFGPFYRTEQVIVYPKNDTKYAHVNRSDPMSFEPALYGPVFHKDFLLNVLRLQNDIASLVGYNKEKRVHLETICFKPMAPTNTNCTIMSLLNYFQNNERNLNATREHGDFFDIYDYFDHIGACTKNPLTVRTKTGLSCLAAFGGPIQPYVVLGDFDPGNNDYTSARGLVITFLLDNHNDPTMIEDAKVWEMEFIRYMRTFSHPNLSVSFMAERSIQDEIERESQSDVFTILISYMFMFGYIAFALGQYQVTGNNLCSLLIYSKTMLGLAGVLIVALSVTSSIGVYAFCGIPATMIILEVQPFLVLAVGVDNIFIFVQAYQRARKTAGETLEMRMGTLSGEVIPSMLLSSLAECFCFFLGALSSMPAVKVFSLYAALAIFFDFFLQITCFLALFTLDIRRQEAGRLEICCCSQLEAPNIENEGFLFNLFKRIYAPYLLSKYVRIGVVLTFLAWLCSSVAVINRVELGLDRRMAVPEDSYVLSHFNNMERFLSVGPPVYFVVKGTFDYSSARLQNSICEQTGCYQDSLGGQVAHAAVWKNRSHIAHPAMNWLDDYIDWLQPRGDPPCCRLFANNASFCPATVKSKECQSCAVQFVDGRPRSDLFYAHIDHFLHDNPSSQCAKGGHAAHGSAVKLTKDGSRVSGAYFMTYHSVLKTSTDFISAMLNARLLATNITNAINANNHGCDVQVFPYSIFYVFYEQYLSIVSDAILQLILSLGAIFVVTTVLLGADPWSGLMVVLSIAFILLNLIGLMYWWRIDFNAISLVNLVMAVGISVEFCCHIVRAFAMSVQPARVDRSREALATMGSSVLSGITLTKFGGIIVLAFAHSQIFKVFYFRMYLGIVLIGAAHGLILLPVMLSFVGPPVNKRKLFTRLQAQNASSGCVGDPLVTQWKNTPRISFASRATFDTRF